MTINSGRKLLLQATEKVSIGANVTVQSGATLEIECGNVAVDYVTFKVMEGATFIVK